MKLYIDKFSKNNDTNYLSFEMVKINKLVEKTNLLLVGKSEMSFSPKDESVNVENDFYRIFKIQFIVSCSIEIANNILIGFYSNEFGELTPYIISELPDGYSQSETIDCFIIDYKGYLEICEITKEKPLSIGEYIEEKKSGNQLSNSLLKYEENYFNWDESKEIYDKIEL